jgi:hypothetical protein
MPLCLSHERYQPRAWSKSCLKTTNDRCEVGPNLLLGRLGDEMLDLTNLHHGLLELRPGVLDYFGNLIVRIRSKKLKDTVRFERQVRRKDDWVEQETDCLRAGLPLRFDVAHAVPNL